MSFLSPWLIALAAGLTVPPLVLLYFLKLRRRELPISSTLLWKRAVEDLQVNSPFQKLRNNLLLVLQLLILLLAAIALGKPMLERALSHESTLVLMIDHSASMAVVEESGETRLEIAKREACRLVNGMPDDARAMVVAFCDRATVVSSFDTDREALKRKINSIEQTQSTSTLSEAIALAEAYSQNLIIAGATAGSEVAPTSAAPPATAVIFTDGRVEDAGNVALQRISASNIEVVSIGRRNDNVGIIAMDAKRNYERPDALQVYATVQNFGQTPVRCDAVLRIRDEDGVVSRLDTQELVLAPGRAPQPESAEGQEAPATETESEQAVVPPGSVAAVSFDEFTYAGGGVIEVSLTADDALAADNRAWTIIRPPRHVRVLLVTEGNYYLEQAIATLPVQATIMGPDEYETADDDELTEGGRSLYDVVIFDRHSTERLPQGSYLFWGAVPKIEGVSLGQRSEDVFIVNWDETHPVLRHVTVETVRVWEEYRLTAPSDATVLMEGETSPVMCYFSRDGSDYLVSSFPLIIEDEVTGQPLMNTTWFTKAHFLVFTYNAIQYLSANVSASGESSVRPGSPVQIPIRARARRVVVARPDGTQDEIPSAGAQYAHYGRTRLAGVYQAQGGPIGENEFAVNLFSQAESDVRPTTTFSIGATQVATGGQLAKVNRPFWPWVLLAVLFVLVLEWVIYNKRVFV